MGKAHQVATSVAAAAAAEGCLDSVGSSNAIGLLMGMAWVLYVSVLQQLHDAVLVPATLVELVWVQQRHSA
jgi:hypothetical protein